MRVVPVTLSGASGQKVTDFGINSGGTLLLQNCQNMPGQRVVVNGEVDLRQVQFMSLRYLQLHFQEFHILNLEMCIKIYLKN